MKKGLHIIDLKVKLHGHTIVALSTTVEPGEVLTIMGPSGSGKSTLLAALTGTLDPAFALTGRIILDDADISKRPPQARQIGLLFQDDLLFPHMTVGENLAFALPATVRPRALRLTRIEQALFGMDLDGFGRRNPATLSGGQRSRVALARCLISDPKALLLDEPFSRLDADLRDQIRNLTFNHAKARDLPVLLVTHDPADAVAAGGRILSPLGQNVRI